MDDPCGAKEEDSCGDPLDDPCGLRRRTEVEAHGMIHVELKRRTDVKDGEQKEIYLLWASI